LKGRSASRYSIAREESAAVIWETREDNGSDVVREGSGSGSGRLRARAILQEFAPRSRTWLNVRFMSYQIQFPVCNEASFLPIASLLIS